MLRRLARFVRQAWPVSRARAERVRSHVLVGDLLDEFRYEVGDYFVLTDVGLEIAGVDALHFSWRKASDGRVGRVCFSSTPYLNSPMFTLCECCATLGRETDAAVRAARLCVFDRFSTDWVPVTSLEFDHARRRVILRTTDGDRDST